MKGPFYPVLCVVVTMSATVARGDTDVGQLIDRIERLEAELREVKQELGKTVTRSDFNKVKTDVKTANEWRDADTLIHMAGLHSTGAVIIGRLGRRNTCVEAKT
jgi:hypothetical protein